MKYFLILIISLCVILCQVAQTIIIHDLKVPHMVILGDHHDDNEHNDHKSVNGHINYHNNHHNHDDDDDDNDDADDANNNNNDINDDDNGDDDDNDDDDDNERIKLDCLYELEDENPTSLVVKWYMDNNLIYQWIRDQQPSVTPYLREHIDHIEITSTDPNHRYRGLTLKHLTTELDGLYKCLVQTENDSKFREEEMNIIDIRNYTITFHDKQIDNETHLECSIKNIYPEPRIHFDADDEQLLYTTPLNVTILDNGYYEASMRAIVQNLDNDDDLFQCYITFPDLPYNITVNAINSGAMSTLQHHYTNNYHYQQHASTAAKIIMSSIFNLLFIYTLIIY